MLQGTLGATLENRARHRAAQLRSRAGAARHPRPRWRPRAHPPGRAADGRSLEPVGRSRRQRQSRRRATASKWSADRRPCCTARTRLAGWSTSSPNDIPRAPVNGAHGMFTFDAGSAASEAGGAGHVTAGNGTRRAARQRQRPARRRLPRRPKGRFRTHSTAAASPKSALSYTGDNGYFGGSFGYDRTHYGIPLVEEGETNLNPRRKIFTLRGERRNIGGLHQLGSRIVRRPPLPARRARRRGSRDLVQEQHHRSWISWPVTAAADASRDRSASAVLTRSFSTERRGSAVAGGRPEGLRRRSSTRKPRVNRT